MVIVHAWESLGATFEARASEWAGAAMIASLAVISFLNVNLFDGPGYVQLRSWADQSTWGVAFVIIGLLRLTVLFVNGAYWRTPHFRSLFAFLSCFVWFQLSLGFATNLSFAIAIFPWLFFLDVYNSLRAAREAGIAQYLHTRKRIAKNGSTLAESAQP